MFFFFSFPILVFRNIWVEKTMSSPRMGVVPTPAPAPGGGGTRRASLAFGSVQGAPVARQSWNGWDKLDVTEVIVMFFFFFF